MPQPHLLPFALTPSLPFLPAFLPWAQVTSNNAESMNAKFSVKRSFDAVRGRCWSEVVPVMFNNTRKHFADAREAVTRSLSVCLNSGLSPRGLDLVTQNSNVGGSLYSSDERLVMPIETPKPFVEGVQPDDVTIEEQNILDDFARCVRTFYFLLFTFHFLLFTF